MSINYIREYMREFYQTEYYEYLMKYIDSKSKQGKSEFFEYKMIKRKSCLVLYYYVRVRNGIRNRKKVK